MIFCITGNAHQPFQRLVNFSVRLAKMLDEELVIQNNIFAYAQCETYQQVGVLHHQDFISTLCRSSFVVTHAGAGTLRTLNTYHKKSICIPRLKVYGEHVNDHQVQIAMEFMDRGLACVPEDYSGHELSAPNAYAQFKEMYFRFSPLSDQNLNDRIICLVRDILGH